MIFSYAIFGNFSTCTHKSFADRKENYQKITRILFFLYLGSHLLITANFSLQTRAKWRQKVGESPLNQYMDPPSF